jgi:hypothetical protein
MKQEYHKTSNVNVTAQPAIIFCLGVISPDILPFEDDKCKELLVPVHREYGTYEELRAYLHNQVDMMFDAHLGLGDFAPK